jgi:DHA3 family macrolide efflux protein-like MFS transporter
VPPSPSPPTPNSGSPLTDPPAAFAAAALSRPGTLANRNFILVWQGQMVSQMGNQAFAVAMMFWLLQATGSASLMGVLMTLSLLPGVLLGPFGGALADRLPRLRIVIGSDLINGVVMLALALTLYLTGRPAVIVPMLCVVAVVNGVSRAVFIPALNALIPDLVPASRLPVANSLNQFSIQAFTILGQGIGGVIYALLGAPLLFLVNALSFLFSAGCSSFVDPALTRHEGAGDLATAVRRFRSDIAEGFAFVRKTPGLMGFMLTEAAYNLFMMPIFVLLPFYVQDYLHEGPEWYGFLLASVSVGAVLGFVVTGMLHLAGRTRSWFVAVLLTLSPTPFLAISLAVSKPVVLILAAAIGATSAMVNIYALSILQATTPPELRGRVVGLLGTVTGALTPVGMLLGGVLGDLSGKNIPLVYGGCGVAALLTTSFVLRRRVRDFLASDDAAPAPARPPAAAS